MRKIYSPEDIEKVVDASLGCTAEELERLRGRERERALRRRARFIEAVGVACALEVLAQRGDSEAKTVVFAGDDINGAYAIETAIELHRQGCPAELYLINIGGNLLKPDAVAARERFVKAVGEQYLFESVDFKLIMPQMGPDSIVVDGLFGREYKSPLRGGYQSIARMINERGALVISIDLPSGMTPDLHVGMINRNIVHADLTLTLVGPSLAFFMPENAELIGRFKTLDLPYSPEALKGVKCTSRLIDAGVVRSLLPRRNPFASKADLGSALIYAGSYGMIGAAVLAARAALRSGCGKVTVHAPRCGYYILQTAVPCAMFETDGGDMEIRRFDSDIEADGIGVGPGLGRADVTAQGLEQFLKSANASNQPVVLDADALNCIAMRPNMLDFIPPRSVLTPHAGEFDRIFGSQPSSSARLLKAIKVATERRIFFVLKGHYTLTVWPEGIVTVNDSASEALATPGSGDVLTGLLTGLIARGLKPELAAVAAVYIHGVAGTLAARDYGVDGTTADDVAACIGNAIDLILKAPAKTKNNRP